MNKQDTSGNAAKRREALAALAAPARNCDMFDDYKSAKDYFLENELWKYNRDLTPEYWFGVWLFELAKEEGAKEKEAPSGNAEAQLARPASATSDDDADDDDDDDDGRYVRYEGPWTIGL